MNHQWWTWPPTWQLAYVAIVGLANARVCGFAQLDGIFKRWRARFFDRFPDEPTPEFVTDPDGDARVNMRPPSFLGELAACPWCLSVWTGTFLVGWSSLPGPVGRVGVAACVVIAVWQVGGATAFWRGNQ